MMDSRCECFVLVNVKTTSDLHGTVLVIIHIDDNADLRLPYRF